MKSANNQTKSVNLGRMEYWRELWSIAKSIAVQLAVMHLYLQPCKRHHGFLCFKISPRTNFNPYSQQYQSQKQIFFFHNLNIQFK